MKAKDRKIVQGVLDFSVANIKNDKSGNTGRISNGEYKILGKVYKAKPLKLQLNKESYYLICKLNEYIKATVRLTDREMKDPSSSFAVSLAIAGFLSIEKNCSDVISLLIEGEDDWLNIINENKCKFEDIKFAALNVLNNFFLNIQKLMNGSKD